MEPVVECMLVDIQARGLTIAPELAVAKAIQPAMKQDLREIWMAPDRAAAIARAQ